MMPYQTLFLNQNKRFFLRKDGKLSFNRAFESPYVVDTFTSKALLKLHQGHALQKLLEHPNLKPQQKVTLLEHLHFLVDHQFLTHDPNHAYQELPSPVWVLDEVFFELTKTCNLKCHHCYIDPNVAAKELKKEKWLQTLESAYDQGLSLLKLTGGEALLSKHLPDILSFTKSKGIRTRLYTNGQLLTDTTLEWLSQMGLNEMQISLDGGTATTHDGFRNTVGNFKHIVDTLPKIIAKGIPLTLSFTASTYNYQEIDAFMDLCEKHPELKVVVSPYINYHQTFEGNDKLLVTEAVIEKLKSTFIQHIDRWSDKTRHYLTYSEKFPGFCGAGFFSLYIDSFGKALLCPLLSQDDHVLGNLNDSTLEDLWQKSNALNAFRSIELNQLDTCPTCKNGRTCRGGCRARAYFHTGHFKGCDPISCQMY